MRLQLSLPLILGSLALAKAAQYCPPAGIPLLPLPDLTCAPAFDTQPLTRELDRLVNESAAFNTSSTSFSVTISTTEDTLFEYHHTAPSVDTIVGVSEVTGDTIYRIFSVTKLFVVLSALLQKGLNLDDYIWQHVPELRGVDEFENTTLRLLASHLSGAQRDTFDILLGASPEELAEELGFPENPYTPPGYPRCESTETEPCASLADFLGGAIGNGSIWPPGRTPSYSNYAFPILGFAIESFANKSLQQIIDDDIVQPLGLSSSTGLQGQDLRDMVVPGDVNSSASLNLGRWNGTAGMFATPNDLARFTRGLLRNELLSSTDLSKWLKPASFTSSSRGEAVGMPWTVVRPTNIPLASGSRPVDVYTMAGGQGYYNAYIALVPEYELGYSVNVAGVGDDPALRALLDRLVRFSVPHFDHVGRLQAREKYAGTYDDEESESSLVLTVDNGPGLKVENWTTGGKAVTDSWVALFGAASQNAVDAEARIYPTGQGDRWQVAFQAISDRNETGIFEGTCYTWFSYGAFRYAGLLVDGMAFTMSDNGTAEEVQIPGLRQRLVRG